MRCFVSQLWAHIYRQNFHCRVDTNNITESFNNVLRKRYLPLRYDTTIYALVQVLVEVVFPEQETRYIQATVKQTFAYRKPRYDVPSYLQARPHCIQGVCLMNMERGKVIPKSHITETELDGNFSVRKSTIARNDPQEEDKWAVSILQGNCNCPSFKTSHVPCKHMFAIFHHFPKWSWNDLPLELTDAAHMLLDTHATCAVPNQPPTERACDVHESFNDGVDEPNSQSPNPSSTPAGGLIPPRTTHGRQIYSLQKKLEDTLGRCRTLAFLTCDIPALETALQQCNGVLDTLATVATTTSGPSTPPVFHAISKAGVDEFRATSKTLHRAGSKRKRNLQTPEQCQTTKRVKPVDTSLSTSNALLNVEKRSAGRPKLKRLQRKRPVLPRQVCHETRAKMVKALAILRRGKDYC